MRFPSELLPGVLWAIHPTALHGLIANAVQESEAQRFVTADVEDTEEQDRHTQSPAMAVPGAEYFPGSYMTARVADVAIIPVQGVLRPRATASFWGGYTIAGALNIIAHDLDLAARDAGVGAVVLAVDSPGGQVTGVDELAELIGRVDAEKPVHAHVSGWGASGAYWLPTSARRITLTPTSEVGSIGALTTYMDFTKLDERIGIEEIQIVSTQSPLKRADPKTPEGFSAIQKRMDALADIFIGHVAEARGVDRAVVLTEFGRGDLVIAEEAVEVGMADEIASLEAVVTDLTSTTTNGAIRMNQAKKGEAVTPDAITVAFVLANCPDVHAAILEQGHKAGVEEGLEKGRVEGAEKERARIQGIEALAVPGLEAFINEAKFDPEQTPESVAVEGMRRQAAGEVDRSSQLEAEGEQPLAGDGEQQRQANGGGKPRLTAVSTVYQRRRASAAANAANDAG